MNFTFPKLDVVGSNPIARSERKTKSERKIALPIRCRMVRPQTPSFAEVFRRRVHQMARTPKIPPYRLHKQSGQAIVTLTDNLGGRHDVLLGRYGAAESREEYARVIAEWEASGRRHKVARKNGALSVNELILAFWKHAE